MLSKILPDYIINILNKELDYAKVYELRLRANLPISINYAGQYSYLSRYGITGMMKSAILADKKLLDGVVLKACDHSVYAVNGQLRNSFITIDGGIRIGICGEVVIENGQVRTIKNYSSVNIRIPHSITNCALKVFDLLVKPVIFSTLLISPPGGGKTTFLRDYARLMCRGEKIINVLILDERSEIAAFKNGVPQFDVGHTSDVLTNCTKSFGFSQGIRALRPDIIIADELMGEDDLLAVRHAVSCGIRVAASVHASSIDDLKRKPDFERLLLDKVFERYVLLSERNGAGTIESVFDEELKSIYFPKP